MRILVINLPCGAPSHGPTYRTHHLAELWARAGHQVKVVGSTFSHLLTQPPKCPGPIWEGIENSVKYCLVRTPSYRKSSFGRALNILSGLARMRFYRERIIGSTSPDIILAASVYQVDNFWAHRTSRECGAAFVRETRDLWPMTLTQLGGMSRWHPLVQWIQHAEDIGYRTAHLVTTTLPNSFEHMNARGLSLDRWEWLPQCPEPETPLSDRTIASLSESHRNSIISRRSRGHLIVAFTGSFVPASDLDSVINAANILQRDPVTFVLVGRGPCENRMIRKVNDLRLTNVIILPPIPKSAVASLLSLCDVGIQVFASLQIYKYGVSPNKIFDYMKSGLPVILSAWSKDNPVAAANAGVVVPPGDLNTFVDAIRFFVALPNQLRREMGLRGRGYVAKHHDLNSVASRYLERFDLLIRTLNLGR